MQFPAIEDILTSKSPNKIFHSRELAHLGDFLVNFIYTTVKIGIKGGKGSTHVWDSSLRTALELANLRPHMGKKTKPDKIADAAEAFIAFAYFHKIMTIDEMIEFLARRLNMEDFEVLQIEKDACATAFSELLEKLAILCARKGVLKF